MYIKQIQYTFFALLFSWNLYAEDKIKSVQVDFYSEKLIIEYPSEIILPGLLIAEDISLIDFYEKMDQTPFEPFLSLLTAYKDQYQLNDWLYFELLDKTLDKIFKRQGPLKKGVTLWFFLTKSGYDTRISYLDNEVYIYAWSKEAIFETPMIIDEEKKFINLSAINSSRKSPVELKLLLFRPGTEGAPFSFKMEKLPHLKAEVKPTEVEFKVKERSFRISFNKDATLCNIMQNYPAIAEMEYFNIPISQASYKTLIPKLEFMLKDKSVQEALGILVAFTRTGFMYKDDNEAFGKSKPMIAEELFHYPYSDCEDRSALFYFLVKELLNLPMLILAYPDHLTIAVASEEIKGQAFTFEGLKYYICDPTGPAGSNIIGIPPNGYENTSFEILGTYHK